MSTQDEVVREKALEHARALGCTCEPDITYVKIHGENGGGGMMQLQIAHDDDCALMSD